MGNELVRNKVKKLADHAISIEPNSVANCA
jgi:hypothetical protein